jgi:hypothetical protein
VARPRRVPRDDLFRIFPSLPFPSTARSRDEQVARMRRLLLDMRSRARANIARQMDAIKRVRERVAEQQRRRSPYRRSR